MGIERYAGVHELASERLIVVAPISPVEVGTEYEGVPPHMTVFPWFELASTAFPRFDAAMRGIVNATPQPTVKGGDRALFGPDEDIPVRRLNRSTDSFNRETGMALHKAVHQAVCRTGGDNFDISHIGPHWKPHITDSSAFRLAENQEVPLPELVVFRRIAAGRKLARAAYSWALSGPVIATTEPIMELHEQAAARY